MFSNQIGIRRENSKYRLFSYQSIFECRGRGGFFAVFWRENSYHVAPLKSTGTGATIAVDDSRGNRWMIRTRTWAAKDPFESSVKQRNVRHNIIDEPRRPLKEVSYFVIILIKIHETTVVGPSGVSEVVSGPSLVYFPKVSIFGRRAFWAKWKFTQLTKIWRLQVISEWVVCEWVFCEWAFLSLGL